MTIWTPDDPADDPLRELALLDAVLRDEVIAGLTPEEREELDRRWARWALDNQDEPEGDDWRVWLIQAGRGFGKTRAGAEWVAGIAYDQADARIALVGQTIEDVERVMIEGESGLLSVARGRYPPSWSRHRGELTFTSGAVAYVYSAAAGEALRGPQHHFAWCDELGKWRDGTRAWDNLMLGLRLGDKPRVLVTTTPKPTKLMYRVLAMAGLEKRHGATRDNPNLPAAYVAAVEQDYAGTRLGRQELEGELIDDREGALWSRDMIEACRVAEAPALLRVVVAVDPPAGGEGADEGGGEGDACGIVAAGIGEDGLYYVIEDASIAGASPARWAAAVADCAARHNADRVVAEKNQGGAMVRAVLKGADVTLPLTLVHASVGKVARAEPVSLQYESGRVRHVGAFPALEDQLCGLLVAGGYAGPGRSPDRADALVWALSELLQPRGKARVRRL